MPIYQRPTVWLLKNIIFIQVFNCKPDLWLPDFGSLPLAREFERMPIIFEWQVSHQINSTNRFEQVWLQCFVSLSQWDLTVVMVTQCESTKEVTDNIDMTNLFSSYFVPLFLLSLSLRHPLCICGPFVPRARVGLVANPSTSPSPPLSDCTAHPFSPHASPSSFCQR